MPRFVARASRLVLAAALVLGSAAPVTVRAAGEPYLIGAIVSESGPA